MRPTIFFLGLSISLLAPWPRLIAASGEFVVVSATAAPEYRRTKGPEGVMAETYVFSPGLRFGGATKDKTQEKIPFLTVAQTLAPALARQKYLPAPDQAKANLVIVVHWGSTETYQDPQREAQLDTINKQILALHPPPSPNQREPGDDYQRQAVNAPEVLNMVNSSEAAAAARADQYLRANAELLGYKRSLTKEEQQMFSSEDETTMRGELSEERYFVVLMAHDYQLLKKEKKSKLLWLTRVSVRAPGNNFTDAVPGMARIAADFFGQQHDNISRLQTKLRDGKVDIGELKVVEPLPAPVAPGSAQPAKTTK